MSLQTEFVHTISLVKDTIPQHMVFPHKSVAISHTTGYFLISITSQGNTILMITCSNIKQHHKCYYKRKNHNIWSDNINNTGEGQKFISTVVDELTSTVIEPAIVIESQMDTGEIYTLSDDETEIPSQTNPMESTDSSANHRSGRHADLSRDNDDRNPKPARPKKRTKGKNDKVHTNIFYLQVINN